VKRSLSLRDVAMAGIALSAWWGWRRIRRRDSSLAGQVARLLKDLFPSPAMRVFSVANRLMPDARTG